MYAHAYILYMSIGNAPIIPTLILLRHRGHWQRAQQAHRTRLWKGRLGHIDSRKHINKAEGWFPVAGHHRSHIVAMYADLPVDESGWIKSVHRVGRTFDIRIRHGAAVSPARRLQYLFFRVPPRVKYTP